MVKGTVSLSTAIHDGHKWLLRSTPGNPVEEEEEGESLSLKKRSAYEAAGALGARARAPGVIQERKTAQPMLVSLWGTLTLGGDTRGS